MNPIRNVNIAADGSVACEVVGTFSYLLVTSATLPFQYSFDGANWNNGEQNTYSGPEAHDRVYFRCVNALASVVTVVFSTSEISRQPDSRQSSASTYVVGNLGLSDNTIGGGLVPDVDPDGYMKILNGTNFPVKGTNNGHRRQQITITTKTNAVSIKSAAGKTLCNLANGNIVTLVTDSDLILNGIAGTALVSTCETFLNT